MQIVSSVPAPLDTRQIQLMHRFIQRLNDRCERGNENGRQWLPAVVVRGPPLISVQVFLLTVMVGNLAEKSLAFSAMPTATRRATSL